MTYKKWSNTQGAGHLDPLTIPQGDKFTVTEKLHGTNFHIWVEKGKLHYGSRNKILDSKSDFFDFQRILLKYQEALDKLLALDEEVHLYGELCGEHIFRRVNYPLGYYVFAVVINDSQLPVVEGLNFAYNLGFDVVPVLATDITFEQVFELDLNRQTACQSRYTGSPVPISEGIEGVVVTSNTTTDHTGHLLKFKIKTPWFMGEKDGKASSPQVPYMLDPEMLGYVNEVSLETFISKHGTPKCVQEIGKFIVLFMDELTEDYLKDHPGKNPKQFRKVIGKPVALILKTLL